MSDSGLGFSYKRFIALIVVFACCILLFEFVGDLGGGLIKSQVEDTTSKYNKNRGPEDRISPVFVLKKNQQQKSNIITAETVPASLATTMNGEEVYNSACLVCHTTGAGGAPLLGDSATWEVRMEQGIETLMEHAIEGYMGDGGIMPAKGGRLDLSDQEVENAVVYMLENSKDQ